MPLPLREGLVGGRADVVVPAGQQALTLFGGAVLLEIIVDQANIGEARGFGEIADFLFDGT